MDLKKSDGSNATAYWEEFLGNADGIERHEDRMFSTAVVINTLLDIWTTRNSNNSLHFDASTPLRVRQSIYEAHDFLMSKIFLVQTPLLNTFFSGSVKGFDSLPFWYPGNKA